MRTAVRSCRSRCGARAGVAVPPLVGALLKNEQDVSLFEKLVFMQRHNR